MVNLSELCLLPGQISGLHHINNESLLITMSNAGLLTYSPQEKAILSSWTLNRSPATCPAVATTSAGRDAIFCVTEGTKVSVWEKSESDWSAVTVALEHQIIKIIPLKDFFGVLCVLKNGGIQVVKATWEPEQPTLTPMEVVLPPSKRGSVLTSWTTGSYAVTVSAKAKTLSVDYYKIKSANAAAYFTSKTLDLPFKVETSEMVHLPASNYIAAFDSSSRRLSTFEVSTTLSKCLFSITFKPEKEIGKMRLHKSTEGHVLLSTHSKQSGIQLVVVDPRKGLIVSTNSVKLPSSSKKGDIDFMDHQEGQLYVSTGPHLSNAALDIPTPSLAMLISASKHMSALVASADVSYLLPHPSDSTLDLAEHIGGKKKEDSDIDVVDSPVREFTAVALTKMIEGCLATGEIGDPILYGILASECVSYTMCPKLITYAFDNKDIALLDACVTFVKDIPEEIITESLRFVLCSLQEKDFSSVKEKWNSINGISYNAAGDTSQETLIQRIFTVPFSAAYLQPYLRQLSPGELFSLLRLVQKWLLRHEKLPKSVIDKFHVGRTLSYAATISWASQLIDAGFATFVSTEECYPLLKQLQDTVNRQLEMSTDLGLLFGAVSHIAAKKKRV